MVPQSGECVGSKIGRKYFFHGTQCNILSSNLLRITEKIKIFVESVGFAMNI